MKKSKFLKKSLATLLALMLVVAMIPVGAAAATPPEVTQVTIDGVEATLSGTEYTAEITTPSTEPTIKVTLKDGIGSVVYGNVNPTNTDGTFTFTMSAEDYAAKKAAFSTYDTDGNKVADYTVTYTEKGKGTDTGVTSVTYADQYGDTQIDGNAYTITVPYATPDSQSVTVVLNDSKATVVGGVEVADGIFTVGSLSVGTAKTFTVEAENGAKKTYTVKLVAAKAFSAFSVEGERKDAAIARVTTDPAPADKTVTVYMPFGTAKDSNNKFKFTPTFTKGYKSATITATKTAAAGGATVEIKSGEEIDLSEFVDLSSDAITAVTLDLTVSYTGTATEEWKVSFNVPPTDSVAAIKGLKVGNFVAAIDGNNITLELPSDLRAAATDVMLLASAGTKVLPVGVSGASELTITGDYNSNDKVTLDLKNNSKFTLRVTAAGTADGATAPEVKDFYLTVKTAEAKPAKLETMTLVNTDGKSFEADIKDDGTVLFTLPYSVKAKADLEDWKLFYTLSSGATITGYNAVTGEKLSNDEAIFPATFDGKAVGSSITVATDNLNSKAYSIAVKNADASKASTLSDLKVTKATTYAGLKDDNTIAGKASGKDWTVGIPYSQYAGYDEQFITASLPENAKLYYIATEGTGTPVKNSLVELTNIDKSVITAAAAGKLPAMATYNFNGKAGNSPLTLVVASEAAVEKITSGTTTLSALTTGTYSTYTLVMKQEDAKKVAKLDSFSVYDAASKTTVNGVISEAKQEITITLPASFAKEVDTGVTRELYLDYSSSNNEVIVANTSDSIKKLTMDSTGKVVVLDSTALEASNDTAKKLTIKPSTDIATISVKSEDSLIPSATATEEKNYKVVVDFAKAETGSTLNSVTINNVTAKPDASNKVVITLPYGSEVTHLVPKFDVSKNAFVSTTTDKDGYIAPETAMNLTSKKTLNVISETGVNKTVYTLEVKVSAQFTDVKEGAWYYDYVMQAAAAGIVNGKGNGIFDPEGNVTRRDFALMTARMLNADTSSYTTSPFKDVNDNDYALGAIAYCYDKKIIGGYEDGTFRPDANISREEAAKIVCVALGLSEVKNPTETFKDDAKIQNWAKGYVYACKEAGIFGGDNGNFLPGNPITRAETAKVMVISMNK